MYNRNDELRKLRIGSLDEVCKILETNGDWRKLMSMIPKDLESARLPTDQKFEPKYSTEHMRQIEDYAQSTRKLCAEVLFDEWGTTGRKRPTLGDLLDLIKQAQILRAADEIACMLMETLPSRPTDGPGAQIDTDNFTQIINGTEIKKHPRKHNQASGSTAQLKPNSSKISNFIKSLGNKPTESVKSVGNKNPTQSNISANIPDLDLLMHPRPVIHIDTQILQNMELIKFEYEELKGITSDFSDVFIHGPQGPTGKIGSGTFGDVYAGSHPQHGVLAIKKFKKLNMISTSSSRVIQTFNDEVKALSQLRHKNIVPIVGYSVYEGVPDSPFLCVVTEYVGGGSLDQNLMAKRLTEKQRINILLGTAMGIQYIHDSNLSNESYTDTTSESINFIHYIHGDIKSVNILLTTDYEPKVCDFGLAKQFNTTVIQPEVSGTQPYIAPERNEGTLTQKSDIYSFGVIILEILTGLTPVVRTAIGTFHIYEYIKGRAPDGDITRVLDPVAAPWSKAKEIYELAQKCLIRDYKERPDIHMVCDALTKISDSVQDGVPSSA